MEKEKGKVIGDSEGFDAGITDTRGSRGIKASRGKMTVLPGIRKPKVCLKEKCGAEIETSGEETVRAHLKNSIRSFPEGDEERGTFGEDRSTNSLFWKGCRGT